MIQFLIDNMAPIMFISMMLVLLIGYSVAFSLAALGIGFGLLGIELGLLHPSLFNALPERVFGVMNNETLMAIPFFTFMGLILERSGMAEDLLDTIGKLFGPIRGGLAYAVILVGALLAATTGVVAASVISMGLISLPIMMRYGYNQRIATGVIAASGTLAQIIPPSLVLIILADQFGRSVGDIYEAALLPGLVLTGLYILYVVIMVIVKPSSAPALPKEARNLSYHLLLLRAIWVLLPPLLLIFLVLGTIFIGWATPTEGGAMGATGAIILALVKRRLTLDLFKQALTTTAKLTTFVVFILIGARVFSLTFYGVNGHIWVEHLLSGLPGGQIGFLIVVNILIFILAFFLDFFELSFIVVPLLAPVAEKLGIDLVWLAVLLGVNMQTSFMHPPFGFALFYLRSVADKSIPSSSIYWGAVPFVFIQILMIIILISFPQLASYKGMNRVMTGPADLSSELFGEDSQDKAIIYEPSPADDKANQTGTESPSADTDSDKVDKNNRDDKDNLDNNNDEDAGDQDTSDLLKDLGGDSDSQAGAPPKP